LTQGSYAEWKAEPEDGTQLLADRARGMPPARLVSKDRPLMETLSLTAGPQGNHDGLSVSRCSPDVGGGDTDSQSPVPVVGVGETQRLGSEKKRSA
jgi:hypothetical protein